MLERATFNGLQAVVLWTIVTTRYLVQRIMDARNHTYERATKKYMVCYCCKRVFYKNWLELQCWVTLVAFCFIYNAFAIPLRAAYPYQTPENLWLWLLLDYSADAIYLLDLLVIQPQLRYIHHGLLVVSDALNTETIACTCFRKSRTNAASTI